jgi:predicted O-linked N-acetylglucosamine transferase (SPINDLY family)
MASLQQYEETAIDFGRRPEKVQALKAKLEAQKKTSPLYNTQQFTKDFESLLLEVYRKCWERG